MTTPESGLEAVPRAFLLVKICVPCIREGSFRLLLRLV